MSEDNLLICPILKDYYENPITLPCCAKTISRDPLIDYFTAKGSKVCPCCRADISSFDAENAVVSRDMIYLVERAKNPSVAGVGASSSTSADTSARASAKGTPQETPETPVAKWKGKIHRLQDNNGPYQKVIGRLEIMNTNNAFKFKTLIIPVIDESGSMSGNPITQARYACQQVLNVVYQNANLETEIVSYESTAITIHVDKKLSIDTHRASVNRIGRGGGTVFRSAFDNILKIAQQAQQNPEITKIVIIFLTDGEDNTAANARGSLAQTFGIEIKAIWKRDFTVHTVGFGAAHDFNFLNALRMIGTEEGAYRFANPQEDTDSLSKKIYSILQVIASSCSIPMRLVSNSGGIPIIHEDNGKSWIDLSPNNQYPGGYNPLASYKFKISIGSAGSTGLTNPAGSNSEEIDVDVEFEELHDYKEIWEQWYSYLTDQISTELLSINNSTSTTTPASTSNGTAIPKELPLEQELHCQLLIHRARAISVRTDPDSPTTTRLKKLIEMTESLLKGAKVDQMSLNDMKFEGKYATAPSGPAMPGGNSGPSFSRTIMAPPTTPLVQTTSGNTVNTNKWFNYSYPKPRFDKTSQIVKLVTGSVGFTVTQTLSHTPTILGETDSKGYNLLMISSSLGRYSIKNILKAKSDPQDINKVNSDGLNALDLAVLYGQWLTATDLISAGAKLSQTIDGQKLLMNCLSKGYYNTATVLVENKLAIVDNEIIEGAPFLARLWCMRNSKVEMSFEMGLRKGVFDRVEKELPQLTANCISLANFPELLINPINEHCKILELLLSTGKADADETVNIGGKESTPLIMATHASQPRVVEILLKYLKPAQLDRSTKDPHGVTALGQACISYNQEIILILVNAGANPGQPVNIDTQDPADKEVTWPLFVAAEKGWTSTVEQLLSKFPTDVIKNEVNRQNLKGTTALWIAACNRHIDVVIQLLSANADPNLANFKGDGPLIPCCQKGCDSIAELLLDAGADLGAYNKNRDNPLIICCRVGQAKILEIFCRYLTQRSTSDRLAELLSQCADIDGFNPLLAAVEQDRLDCIRVCHKFGADLEFRTNSNNPIIAGATALHLACFYGQAASVQLLIQLGCNLLAQTTVSGASALQIAIKQGKLNIVRLLMAQKCRDKLLDMKDADGKPARFYANMNGNEAILDEFFTDKLSIVLSRVLQSSRLESIATSSPVGGPLMLSGTPGASGTSTLVSNASTSITVPLEARCAEVLLKYGQSPTCFEYDQLTNRNIDGRSFLSHSILNGNNHIAQALTKMNANVDLPDETGIPASFWLTLVSGKRPNANVDPTVKLMLDRVDASAAKGFQNKMLTGISNTSRPLAITASVPSMNNLIKMGDGYSNQVLDTTVSTLQKVGQGDQQLMGFLEKLKNNKVFPDGKSCLEFILWDAKIHAISLIAKGELLLQPIHLIALYLYTGNYTIYRNVNMALAKWDLSGTWHPFISCLYQGIRLLPAFVGECYRAITPSQDALNVSTAGITTGLFDPELHKIGTRTRWNTFSLCCCEWKDAGELVEQKKGIVFIIKSQTGRVIAPYSKYPVDNEVVFLPGTEFEITDHYVGKIFVLGQANIRKTSYKMKEVDYERVAKKEACVIIELTEIVKAVPVTPLLASS